MDPCKMWIWEFSNEERMMNGKIYIMHPIFVIFCSKRLEWAGHVWRTEGCLIRKSLTGKPSEKRLIERDHVKDGLTWRVET